MPQPKKPLDIPGYHIPDPTRAYLGEGTYGTVYLAKETASDRYVAIKQHHPIAYEKGIPSSVLRETTLLKLLKNSPFVVRLREVFNTEPTLRGHKPMCYMVFDYMKHDLSYFATKYKPLDTSLIQRLVYHILMGIHHCHSMGLMHRDLKPHNILMDMTNPTGPMAKLADFGFGRSFGLPIRQLTDEVITLWYRPPEVLLSYKGGHSPSVDIWSVACILSELYEGATLFCGRTQYEQLLKIFQVLGTPSLDLWPGLEHCDHWHEYAQLTRLSLKDHWGSTPIEAINLLEAMLAYDPTKRPTAEACLRHPYFQSIFNEADLTMPGLDPFDIANHRAHNAHQSSEPLLPSQSAYKFSGIFGKNADSF